jgi:hypothetical protein
MEGCMSWRDLKPLDDWYELERPVVMESASQESGGQITLIFNDRDGLSREWWAEWLRSKRGWTAFMAWVDEKR